MAATTSGRNLLLATLLAALAFACCLQAATAARRQLQRPQQEFGATNERMLALRSMSKRALVNRVSILESAYICIMEAIERLLKGEIKFPKSCCAVPLFNFICNNGKRK